MCSSTLKQTIASNGPSTSRASPSITCALGTAARSISANWCSGSIATTSSACSARRAVWVPMPAPTSSTRPWSHGRARSTIQALYACAPAMASRSWASASGTPGRIGSVRVCVLTTSYPRSREDAGGRFVAEAVEHLRAAGLEVTVVSPVDFHHFGIAFGGGIVQNLKARPWLVLLLPLFLVSFARAARRGARDADVVHAHWIPSGIAAIATGKPFVLQVWGTDVEIARRLPWLVRPIVRRARAVIAASSFLAGDARALGARDVRVIPNGVAIPEQVG